MLDNKTEKEQDLANNKSDMITEETSEKIENNLAIKERIMVELDKEDLLDFQFLFSTEVI